MRPSPVLDLVEDQQCPVLVAQLARGLEVFGRRGVDAALALHDLEQQRADPVVESRVERVNVVQRDMVDELGRHGREWLVLRRLSGRRQRRDGPTVERPERGDEPGAPRPALLALPAARELHRALVRLGAGVREEDLPPAEQVVQPFREQHLRLGVVEVRHVGQHAGLRADGLDDLRVRVPDAHHGDAGDEVEVFVAVGVPEPAPGAAGERHGLPPVHGHVEGAFSLADPIERLAHALILSPSCRRLHP